MNTFRRPSRRQRGSTLIVVMALLAVMCVLMICAAQSIGLVKRELRLIERKQLRHWEKAPARP